MSLQIYLEQLDAILKFEPAHLSVYTLSIEEGTPLAGRVVQDEKLEELQRDVFLKNAARLVSAGYIHYEISNFCRPGKESQHNLKYWKYLPYAGFGPSAHSFIDGVRWSNSPDLNEYLNRKEFPRMEDVRGRDQAMVEFIMTGLRLLDRVSLTSFRKIFNSDLPAGVYRAVKILEEEGQVQCLTSETGEENIRIAYNYLVMSDNIIYRIVESLLP